MNGLQKIEFIVTKKSYSFSTCNHCKGSGRIETFFREMSFVKDCPKCNGEGRIRHSIVEEYPLNEAIAELGFVKI